MLKRNKKSGAQPSLPQDGVQEAALTPGKTRRRGGVGRFFRRFLLCFFTVLVLLITALCLVLNLIFNGPSESARAVLTMSLTEASATKWVPGVFMDDETVAAIRKKAADTLPDEVSDTDAIVIDRSNASGSSDEWAKYPDGIRIDEIKGKTYNAHIMLIRDPSLVYMATCCSAAGAESPG